MGQSLERYLTLLISFNLLLEFVVFCMVDDYRQKILNIIIEHIIEGKEKRIRYNEFLYLHHCCVWPLQIVVASNVFSINHWSVTLWKNAFPIEKDIMIDTRIIEYLFRGNNKNIKDKANISLCLLQIYEKLSFTPFFSNVDSKIVYHF